MFASLSHYASWFAAFMLLVALNVRAELPNFIPLAEEMSESVVSISGFHSDQLGREGVSYGSGFIYSKDGYIITNDHVTKGAQQILVRFSNRIERNAVQIGADELTDIALLKVDVSGLDLQPARIGDSEKLRVGQWVAAIGSPFGFDYTLTAGVVSALGRSLPNDTYVPFIQTDVAVNEGNSGGPLFTLDGSVVGINTKIFTQTGSFAGLSFSIPMHIAVQVVNQLRDSGVVTRGWLGVSIRDVPRQLVGAFGLDRATGALVVQIDKQGPAYRAGIRNGDVIVEFDNNPIIHSGDLPVFVGQTLPQTQSTIKLIREGRETTLVATLGEKKGEKSIIGANDTGKNELGLQLSELEPSEAQLLGIEGGVIIRGVLQGSLAAKAGLEPGDIITHFYQTPITSKDAFFSEMQNYPSGKSVPIRVLRQKTIPLFVALDIP